MVYGHNYYFPNEKKIHKAYNSQTNWQVGSQQRQVASFCYTV